DGGPPRPPRPREPRLPGGLHARLLGGPRRPRLPLRQPAGRAHLRLRRVVLALRAWFACCSLESGWVCSVHTRPRLMHMDRITKSLLDEFRTQNSLGKLDEARVFEHFIGYLVTSEHFSETFSTD